MRISDWSSDVCSSDLVRTQHRPGIDEAVEGRGIDEAAVERGFLQRAARLVRVLCDLRRLVIADLGRERGAQHQRAVHHLGDAGMIGISPHDASFSSEGQRWGNAWVGKVRFWWT